MSGIEPKGRCQFNGEHIKSRIPSPEHSQDGCYGTAVKALAFLAWLV